MTDEAINKANNTGAMVALFLPDEVAEQIVVPGGLPPEELHTTLAYLGEAENIPDPAKLRRNVEDFARSSAPLSARLGGVIRFNGGDEQAFCAALDAPKLPDLRQRLVERLADIGIPAKTNHGFTPHITLKYLKPDEPAPLNNVPEIEFLIDHLTLALADERISFPFGETAKVENSDIGWSQYCDILKIDEEGRIVEGVATSPEMDDEAGIWLGQAYEGDVVETDAIRAALPDYMQFANVREMHQPSAAGVVLEARILNEPMEIAGRLLKEGALYIRAKIVDDQAWTKVKEGVYKGFSIGGKVLSAIIDKINGRTARVIKALKMVEISLVDRPRNPASLVLLWKGDFSMADDKTNGTTDNATTQPDATLDKMDTDHMKAVIEGLQAMRSGYETARNWTAAKRCSRAIESLSMMEGGDDDGAADDDDDDDNKAQKGDNPDGAALLKTILDSDGLTKAIQPHLEQIEGRIAEAIEAIDPLKNDLKATQETLEMLDGRLKHLEEQPAPGGPVLRAVDKSLATDVTNEDDKGSKQTLSKAQLDEMKLKATTEPNPALRALYNQQYTQALESLVK